REKEILTFVSHQIASAITQKRRETALRESEAKFRAVADTAASAIYVHDRERFLYVNRAIESMTGYTREELLRKSPADLYGKESEVIRRLGAEALPDPAEPLRLEFQVRRKDKVVRWWDFSGSLVEFDGRTALLGTAFDVTARKESEHLQDALYRIAAKVSSAGSLEELYRFIHSVLGEFMYARNCFIALHDKAQNVI